ncbi:MAG: lipoyl(octanoyl) transferase LipB [Alphaproteobacteria bacterium]|nr:lipoyl(octanoyl) transferase LipB [Alphaproteobacteria bacterium]
MTEPALAMATRSTPSRDIEWLISCGLVPYEEAVRHMEARVAAIAAGEATECVWLLEHPPIYTAGTSADLAELLDPHRFPVFRTGRGGRFTYHGPGQRVAYVMLDLNKRGRDVRAHVGTLEDWLIAALARLGADGERHKDQVGIFTGGAKIASIGVRVRRWVTFHGASLNVSPDLEHFSGIVPCGLTVPVTSLEALGLATDMDHVDAVLRESFTARFNASVAP